MMFMVLCSHWPALCGEAGVTHPACRTLLCLACMRGGFLYEELTSLGAKLDRLAEQADALQGLIQRAADFNYVRMIIEEIPSERISEEARQRVLDILAEEEQDARAKVRRYREKLRL